MCKPLRADVAYADDVDALTGSRPGRQNGIGLRACIISWCALTVLLSPQSVLRVEKFGREQQPIVVIDNAFVHPERLSEDACARQFTHIGPYYPGVRAVLGADFTQNLCDAVQDVLADHLKIARDRWAGDCFYSLVTTPPEKLQPIQRFPHFDGVEDERIAMVYYLCKPEHGGTSFYRHRATGFETVDAARFQPYRSKLEAKVREIGLPPAQYIDDGAPLFERTGKIDAMFNRMLIYRGVNLHCSAIPDSSLLSSDPRKGRLTINAFLAPRD